MALYLIATPIGNLADISQRALETLEKVDLILAEDTRKTGLLLQHYKIRKPLFSFHEHNEVDKLGQVLQMLTEGKEIALVSDAGTPTISDPGFKLVREATAAGVSVTSLPGASAVLAALTISGLPTDRFLYLGYLPKSGGKAEKLLTQASQAVAILPSTIVIFESPHRLTKTLEKLARFFPKADLAVTKELTKIHETVVRGKPGELFEKFKTETIKGEFTLVLRN
ncbi:MAG: 16S rRNA (cytidine(1402)-2'-O)-methyltransferase [bacterium]|nr:16S rRNA (cytidine(1402)-2'-O)-methyltransferase [bacterium]